MLMLAVVHTELGLAGGARRAESKVGHRNGSRSQNLSATGGRPERERERGAAAALFSAAPVC